MADQTVLHVQRVRSEAGIRYWICDEGGERLLKTKARGYQDAAHTWRVMHNVPAELTRLVTYRGESRPAEAAMTVADLQNPRPRR